MSSTNSYKKLQKGRGGGMSGGIIRGNVLQSPQSWPWVTFVGSRPDSMQMHSVMLPVCLYIDCKTQNR